MVSTEKTTKLWCYKELPVNYKTINSLLPTFFKDNPKTPEGFTLHRFRHYHVLQGINIKEVSKRYNTNYIREVISIDMIM